MPAEPRPVAPPPVPVPTQPKDRWLPDGVSVDIAGVHIRGGLLYVGSGLASERGTETEPALIDPRLPVDHRRPDLAGEGLTYFPSYSSIAPAARAAYLHWLAEGRSAPDANIGYVFLYFYGLERRLIVDDEPTERTALVAEVRRLLSIYGEHNAFERRAQDLLGFLAVHDAWPAPSEPPAHTGWLPELPMPLRVGLAQYAARAEPIPANWALAWITALPDYSLRTPAQRCAAEFAALFDRYYHDEHGAGLVITPSGPPISVEYRAASMGVRSVRSATYPGLSDISGRPRAITALRAIAERATTDLDAYSRYLGRHPDGARDSAAVAVLPAALPITEPSDAVRGLWSWAEGALRHSATVRTSVAGLIESWPDAGQPTKLSKPDLVVVAQLLDRIAVGIEPDPRFDGSPPAAGKPVVLFRRASNPVNAPNPEYPAAVAAVNLGMLVALADGTVTDSELLALREHAIQPWDLSEDEQRRLDAHAELVTANPPTPAVLRRRLSQLPEAARTDAGQLLITVAAADGEITSDEVRSLETLFRDLDLDPRQIYSTLHSAAATTAPDDLTDLRTSGDTAPRVPLPPQPAGAVATTQATFTLDPVALAAKRAESARAAAQLAEIFADDDEPDPPPAQPDAPAQPDTEAVLVAGLDSGHSRLFALLVARPSWTRAEVDELATSLGLLTDGALETINEAAFDLAGAPLTEGADPITIDTEIAEDMHG